MIKIAISGNIASGKTEVEKILLKKGYKVLDTDKVCHKLISSNKFVIEQIVEIFGISILDENHQISRQKLGEIAFTDSSKKNQLEKILHPKIKEETEKFFEKNSSESLLFVSVPLLFEAKMEKYFDKIIFVSAKEDIRLKRLINRNQLTKEQAQLRLDAQQKEQNKIALSDFIIENNTNLNDLELKVNDILLTFNGLL